MKKTKLGIESKTIIVYTTFTLIVLILFGFVSFIVVRKSLEKELNITLMGTAKTAVDSIGDYKMNFEPGDEANSEYITLQQKLKLIKDITGLNNILIVNNTHDVLIDANGDENIGSHYIFSKYYKRELERSFKIGTYSVSPVYKGEFKNLLKSAFVPIKHDNAVLIAEANPKFLRTLEELSRTILYLGMVVIVISVIVSFIFVRKLIVPIEELSKERENKAREMEIIAAGIAHEVRNPMSALSGFAELLNKRVSDSSLKAISENIIDEVKSLDNVVNDFLDFARPVSLNKQEIDINQLLDESIEICFPDSENEKSIEIVKNYDFKIKKIDADYDQLKHCFINLIRNAKEAMQSGGRLTIKTRQISNYVRAEIIDTGTGFSKEIADKIFLPFFTTKDKGTGVGLSIVKKTISAHNGKIEVESKVGMGSNFTVMLPVEK